ncbi:hypothetical protein GGR50DRAFT_690122 [Xylaria sp. CBS 124048]|nr:hypothetical protein GGR50DRAFT_690122 [Xylaria sp. CBS 124048]
MPRKVRPAADTAQNRQNQQRSRARRKAYVAELEARVRAFEEAGVEATLEMQQAARGVAWVNARLMELLATKGVGRDEVDSFLRRAGEESESESAGAGAGGGEGMSWEQRTSKRGLGLEGLLSDGQRGGRATEASCGHASNHPPSGGKESFIRVCDGVSETPKQIPSVATGDASRALVTSCDDAASIIADFQGHGDVLLARKVLRCGDAADCHVKNTRLFQLMDEAG